MYFVLPLIKPKINSLHISDVFNIFSKAGGFHNKKHVLVDDIKLMIDYFYKYYPADIIRGVVVWLVMVNSMDAISVSMYCKLMIFSFTKC